MPITDDLITKMKDLCLQETETLWIQGDLLVAAALGEEDLRKLAEMVQRKVMTLRERERVAREFPEAMRDKRHAWTIYRVLTRIPDAEAREKLLNARSEWTIEAMELEVRRYGEAAAREKMAKSDIKLAPVATKLRGGMRFGNVRVSGEMVEDQLTLKIEHPVLESQIYPIGRETVATFRLDIAE